MEPTTGIIYLIQPCEIVGTNRYKIGCSKEATLNRVQKGYKNGTRYLAIHEVRKPLLVEKYVKERFSRKFKLCAGNEYYQGDERQMRLLFAQIIMDYLNESLEMMNAITTEDDAEFDDTAWDRYDDELHFDDWK